MKYKQRRYIVTIDTIFYLVLALCLVLIPVIALAGGGGDGGGGGTGTNSGTFQSSASFSGYSGTRGSDNFTAHYTNADGSTVTRTIPPGSGSGSGGSGTSGTGGTGTTGTILFTGRCGSAHQTVRSSMPSGSAACARGRRQNTNETDSGFTWRCRGTLSRARCSAAKPGHAPSATGATGTAGVCGDATNHRFLDTNSPPNSMLCTAGNPSSPTAADLNANVWNWTCAGQGGGSDTSCSTGLIRRELSVAGCDIAIGAGSCTSTITWDLTNAYAAVIRNATHPSIGTYATNVSGGGSTSGVLLRGENIVRAEDTPPSPPFGSGLRELRSREVTVNCQQGSTWQHSTGMCIPLQPAVQLDKVVNGELHDGSTPIVPGDTVEARWTASLPSDLEGVPGATVVCTGTGNLTASSNAPSGTHTAPVDTTGIGFSDDVTFGVRCHTEVNGISSAVVEHTKTVETVNLTISLSALPNIIRSGQQATLEWSFDFGGADPDDYPNLNFSCDFVGAIRATSVTLPPVTSSTTTPPLFNFFETRMSCSEATTGAAVEPVTVDVEVIPRLQET